MVLLTHRDQDGVSKILCKVCIKYDTSTITEHLPLHLKSQQTISVGTNYMVSCAVCVCAFERHLVWRNEYCSVSKMQRMNLNEKENNEREKNIVWKEFAFECKVLLKDKNYY